LNVSTNGSLDIPVTVIREAALSLGRPISQKRSLQKTRPRSVRKSEQV